MESKIAKMDLSLWCEDLNVPCPHLCLTGKLMLCEHYGKVLMPDTRLHRDGHAMRLDECMMVDIVDEKVSVEEKHDNKKDYHDEAEECCSEKSCARHKKMHTKDEHYCTLFLQPLTHKETDQYFKTGQCVTQKVNG
jgi:hypothetical protein